MDESAVGGKAEGLTDDQIATARHEAYKAGAYAEDRENAERGKVEPPTLDDLQNLLDVASLSLGATGVGESIASAADWARYFNANPGAQARALDAVMEASRATDATFGTQITSSVWENLMQGNFTPYP